MPLDPLQLGRIVHGDALRVLGHVPEQSFDTIFFDWPYSQGSAVRGKDDGAAARVYGPVSFLVKTLQEAHRLARVGAHLYLFCDWKGIPDVGLAMSLSGWFPTTIIAWDKCYVGTGGFWRSSWDPIFFASKGPADKRTEKAFPNVIRTPAVRQGRDHPYEKPLELWQKLCEPSVVKNCLVLDMFAGSGSSRAPVEALGGAWYGLDVDPAFADSRVPVPLTTYNYVDVNVSLNGEGCGYIQLRPNADEATARAEAERCFRAHIGDRQVKKVGYVPNKIINLIVG